MTSKNSREIIVDLPKTVGKGYGQFWKSKARYRVCKGSRASKKSKTTALWIIASMMAYPGSNTLVVRKVFRTLKDSCYTDLKWAVHRLKVDAWWDFKESPLEATYNAPGGRQQKIYFRGLDDPLKIASIAVEDGSLCWMWIEEAYEIMKEADFDMLDESIRGEVGGGLFKQITITFNPWNEHHWLKARFFDVPDDQTLAITTDYRCNEWLDESDRRLFEEMKVRNPRRYQVAGCGEWGIVEGLIYENWREESFTIEQIQSQYPDLQAAFGLDYGYTNDPTALFAGYVSLSARKIFVHDELYKKGLSNRAIYQEIIRLGYGKERITGDSAEPKSNDELKSYGLHVTGAKKGPDSIKNGIQWIQDFEIIVHPRCVNFLTEISNYTWDKDRFGNKLNVPVDDFNHLMDAMRYGLERFIIDRKAKIKTFAGGI